MRGGRLVATAVLLGACGGPAAMPGVAPSSAPATFPASSAVPSSPLPPAVVDASRQHLTLFVDDRPIRPGTCAAASVSIASGRPRVSLQWRSGGSSWRPWPVGPARGIHRGAVSLPLCPGWSDEPLEVRSVAEHVRPSPAERVHARAAPWMQELEVLIGHRPLSASVMVDGSFLYGHLAAIRRAPASNEKVLLSMALLDRFGPDDRIATVAASRARMRKGVVHGDLYLVGQGDPELADEDLHRLALRLRAAGLVRVDGAVVGDTGTFMRDRHAWGWHPIALRYIGLPTALSYRTNVDANGFVFHPELAAAEALEAELRALGVRVGAHPARDDRAPDGLRTIAAVRSARLEEILWRQNVSSINLAAETLSKALATEALGVPGSIADGASVIERWANGLDADVTLHDASGLSYRNRVSTASMAALLDHALRRGWGDALMSSLPKPGEGTLGGRLSGLPVRAKTGTLIRDVSALSGYVRLRDGRLASFSIMSALPKSVAVAFEDEIVRTIATNADPPTSPDDRRNGTFGEFPREGPRESLQRAEGG